MLRVGLMLMAMMMMACGVQEAEDTTVTESGLQSSGKSDDGNESQEMSEEIAEETTTDEGEAEEVEAEEVEAEEVEAEEVETEEEVELDEDHDWVVDGEDICESFGMYEDDTCHEFCPQIDPACPESVYEELEEEEEGLLGCEWEIPFCAGQGKVDTDQNGCADTCVEEGVECAVNADCGEGDYCARPKGECGALLGTCTEMIDCGPIDFETWEPELVCGCDGITHVSPCDAQMYGANIDYDGICEYED